MNIILSDSERLQLRRYVEYTQDQIKDLSDPDISSPVLQRLKNQYIGRLDGVMKALTVLNIEL